MEKRCKGCGSLLQSQNANDLGYVLDLNKDFCQRCFRLKHYNDFKYINPSFSISNLLDDIKIFNKPLIIYVVDAIEAMFTLDEDILKCFNNYDLLIIIDKIDIFPSDFSDQKIYSMHFDVVNKYIQNYQNIVSIFQTSIFDQNIKKMLYELCLDKYESLIFVGKTNAGKSSLINKLCNSEFTVSKYANTSIGINVFKDDKYTYVDTAGFINQNETSLTVGRYVINKLKPKTFQVYSNQSYFIEALFVLSVITNNKVSVTFYFDPNYQIHRTNYLNTKNYYEKHLDNLEVNYLPFNKLKTFKVVNSMIFGIENHGYFIVNGTCNIEIKLNDKIKVYQKKGNM